MARGNRHWGRIFLVLLLIVIVLVIAADRIGVAVAEREVATKTQTQLASEDITMSAKPSVTIDGIPFLTQVASGHYQKIVIVIPDPTSKGVRLDSLHVTATDVNAPTSTVMSGGGEIKADKVVGTAQIDWKSLQQLVDLTPLKQYGVDPSTIRISGTNNGQISLSAPASLLGQSFTVLATGTVALSSNLLHIRVTKVSTADSTLPTTVEAALRQLRAQLTFDVRIPALPYQLKLNSVNSNAQGVQIAASAANVVLGS